MAEHTDPHLGILLDPALLSAAVGASVRATWVRPKTGVKHVAALTEPQTGQPVGWVQVLIGPTRVKADKARLTAEELGLGGGVRQRELPSGALLVWGPVETDPRLARALHPLDLAGASVLRYNPLRRLVARVDGTVVRVTAEPHRRRWVQAVRVLSHHRIPVLRRATQEQVRETGLRLSRWVSAWQWVEGRDLSHAATAEEQRRAGRLLARLHGVPPSAVPDLQRRGWREVRGSAEATVAQLEQVAPEQARAARAVLEELPSARDESADVLLHGDFSLDQCLARADGEVVLGDLDRLCHGPAEVDLGSLWAVALIEGTCVQAVQDAYGAPAPHACWVAAALLSRVSEPWRAQEDGWEQEVARRSALAAGVLADGVGHQGDASAAAWQVPLTVRAGGETVQVHRAWPAGELPRVVVEGPDGQGRLRAGTVRVDGRVRLLPPGEDPKLPGLAEVARQGRLVVHRAGRRAVVALPDRYAKVVRPGRAGDVAAASESGARLVQAAGLAAPTVLGHDESLVELSVLPGRPVHLLHDDPSWPQVWQQWAAAWTAVQRLGGAASDELARHTPADEARVLRQWAARAEASGVLRGTPWPDRLEQTARRLGSAAPGGDAKARDLGLVVTHRDLHDQQLLWDGSRLGVLDLDTLCLAEPALDPVNLLVHAHLRHGQGLWSAACVPAVEAAVQDVLEAAGVADGRRSLAERATLARLAAVYAFRPRWRARVLAWAETRWRELQ